MNDKKPPLFRLDKRRIVKSVKDYFVGTPTPMVEVHSAYVRSEPVNLTTNKSQIDSYPDEK